MLPEEFVKRIELQPYIDGESLTRAFLEPPPVSIRINASKWSRIPSGSEKIAWCSDGWYLGERPSYTLDPLFHAGCYYPQEASSMFLSHVFRQIFNQFSNLKILDLCGAPGGKSTHLSSLVGDKGFLVANEVIKSRASVLAENLSKWGLANSIVTNSDPAAFAKVEGYFDLIVADAPCSGEGMFRDEIARKEWSAGNALMCSERQRRIVMDVWPALKRGGYLIYSTCTFNPAENEENIRWFCDQTGAASVPLTVNQFTGVREISYKGITGYGFYPGRIKGEGFFIAVLKKISGGISAEINRKRSGVYSVPRNLISYADRIVDTANCHISFNNGILTLVPVPENDMALLKSHLRIIRHGTDLFRIAGSDYIPQHDLALTVRRKSDSVNEYEVTSDAAIEFLRKGNVEPGTMGKGWVLLKYKGVGLGFVKNLGRRVNNNYPVDWRIRMNPADFKDGLVIKWD